MVVSDFNQRIYKLEGLRANLGETYFWIYERQKSKSFSSPKCLFYIV